MTNEEIREKLFSKKSPDRKKAAKTIAKNKLKEFGDELYAQYLEEKKDKRTWETQCEMIKTLGLIDYKQAIENIYEIVKENQPHDAITLYAALAYIRLKRKSINDGKVALELLDFGRISIIEGVLMVLAIDKMIPDNEIIEKIIKKCWNLHQHEDMDVGIGDCRKYLAIACANWNINLTQNPH